MKILRLLLLFVPLLLCACSINRAESAYHIEYLNKDKSSIIEVSYEPEAKNTHGLIREFLKVLTSDSENVNHLKPIPAEVELLDYELKGKNLSLYFDANYYLMSPVEEVLCRAAVVRTLTQIKGVSNVTFYVDDAPLADTSGNPIGIMSADSFIRNPGEQINSIQSADVVLYFANETGEGLVKEVRKDVHYSSNVSVEKLIMEQLLEGPTEKGAKATIPTGTKLMAVTLVDGVCYVSLDETFQNHDYKVSEAIVIYSIVNSLTELKSINRVQISINGDTSGVYRDSFALSLMYQRNLDYLKTETME